MQTLNWNDLRFILAIRRGRTMAAAARLLDVDDTTVARRLAAAQEATGARLCQRLADGTLQLTTSGERALLHAERIEREVSVLDSALSGNEGEVAGTVRVTSVPIIVNRLLVPASQAFLKRHPSLRLELVGDARDLSLTRREADLALRLGRPKTGGMRVITRRIGSIRYEVYASARSKDAPLITYDEAMAHLPQAAWIAANAAQRNERLAAVRVNDAEGVVEAVLAGLGSLLPCMVADRDARLTRLGANRGSPALIRELWLLMHSELKKVGRIEAVVEWIERIAPR
jgi:DNA-binding transcriptional LysR family regulator